MTDPRPSNADATPTAPLWAGIYGWAWFAGSLIAGLCHLVGMRAFAPRPATIAGSAR